MGRPCKICSDARKLKLAARLIAEGLSDQAVADAINALDPNALPISFMAANRHRRAHVERPARVLAEIANRGQAAAAQRTELLATASTDPGAYLTLGAIVRDLQRVQSRLEAAADRAAEADLHTGHAALAGQWLRGAELRTRMAGLDRSGRAAEEARRFSISIIFSGGETVSIAPVPGAASGEIIDAEPEDE
jgi:hypothetical protein